MICPGCESVSTVMHILLTLSNKKKKKKRKKYLNWYEFPINLRFSIAMTVTSILYSCEMLLDLPFLLLSLAANHYPSYVLGLGIFSPQTVLETHREDC